MHMLKAYKAAIPDEAMKFNSGLDRLFGVVGFFERIQSKSVKDILADCEAERNLYSAAAKKAYLYDSVTGEAL